MNLFIEITKISIAPYLNADEQKVLIDGVKKDYKDVELSDVIIATNSKILNEKED